MSIFNRSLRSPDGSREAALTWLGEIPFGPCYYALSIDGVSLGERVFGDTLCWSDDSALLAIEEWLTTDRQRGPITQLTVIDPAAGRHCALAQADKGFFHIHSFTGRTIAYQEKYYGTNTQTDCQQQLPPPHEWSQLRQTGQNDL